MKRIRVLPLSIDLPATFWGLPPHVFSPTFEIQRSSDVQLIFPTPKPAQNFPSPLPLPPPLTIKLNLFKGGGLARTLCSHFFVAWAAFELEMPCMFQAAHRTQANANQASLTLTRAYKRHKYVGET